MMKLQRAKEQNETLDVENTALRERVCTLESEKKKILDQVGILQFFFIELNKLYCCCSSLTLFCVAFVQLAINDQDVVTKEDQKDKSISSEQQNNLSGSSTQDKDYIHKR